MTVEITDQRAFSRKWVHLLIIILLILCVFFRFVNIDKKLYTIDEVRGLLRISGYTNEEFIELVSDGQLLGVEDLLRYERPNPEKGLNDAVKALAGNPEHPPLYYLMARFAVGWFDNPAAARILSALISFLVFPCLYWLCLELFSSPMTGWIAIALVAISPFHLMLAQEARQYTLWAVAILLSSVLLLKALRVNKIRAWGLYAATIALGIYSHLFFALVALAHGVYVGVTEGFKLSKKLVYYLLASLAGMLIFTPWILVVITNLDTFKKRTRFIASIKTEFWEKVQYWLHNLSVIFVDYNQLSTEMSWTDPFYYLTLILAAYAIYFLCRNTPKQVWLFIVILVVVPSVCLVIPDLIQGGGRSLFSRYLLPSYLAIEIAVAYLLSSQISRSYINIWQQKLWQLLLVIIILTGGLSCNQSSQATHWWKGSSGMNLGVAPILNQSVQPLVITDAETFVLPLSYLLEPKVKFQLFTDDTISKFHINPTTEAMMKSFSDVFLYLPSQELQDKINQSDGYDLKLVVGESKFFPNKNLLYKVVKQ